jgi:DNA-binding transcriptional ArsR family regulator
MPLFPDDLPKASPAIAVGSSIAVELEWALAAAMQRETGAVHPALERVYRHDPGLADRARGLWAPGEATSCGGCLELVVLAHHGGLLLSDQADNLLGGLEDLCARAPSDLRLASETAADRSVLNARLGRLRSSRKDRRRYVEVVTDIWSAVAEDWQREGRLVVNGAVGARHQVQASRAGLLDIIGDFPPSLTELLKELVAELAGGGTIAIVPSYLGSGLLIDLPGAVVVGVRADRSELASRGEVELWTRRLKAISNPTRLKMLKLLRGTPMSVTELATTFAISQPTVSSHVKLLRETGLVAQRNKAGRQLLVVEATVVADILRELEETLGSPER